MEPALLSDDVAIRRAVEAAGWTFVRFGGRLTIVEGREFDTTHFTVGKGRLVGQVTLLRGDSASDAFIHRVDLHPTRVSAVRGTATLKVGVNVHDNACAMEELRKLTAHPRPDGFFGYVGAISEHGWTIDRDRTREDDYDFTWSIVARREEDELSFYVGFSGATQNDQPVHISDSGGACMIESRARWSVDVRVAAPARELAEALLRG